MYIIKEQTGILIFLHQSSNMHILQINDHFKHCQCIAYHVSEVVIHLKLEYYICTSGIKNNSTTKFSIWKQDTEKPWY